MKMLFDQNISFRVLKDLEPIFPGSLQVRLAGLENETDSSIWSFAKQFNFIVVTFDGDFADIVNLKGFPPKVIWLRFIDQHSSAIVLKIKEKEPQIKDFAQDPEFGVLELR